MSSVTEIIHDLAWTRKRVIKPAGDVRRRSCPVAQRLLTLVSSGLLLDHAPSGSWKELCSAINPALLRVRISPEHHRLVAQLGEATRSDRVQCRFESDRAYHATVVQLAETAALKAAVQVRIQPGARMVKILERTEIMGDVPTRRNGCGKTLRVKSGPCNVVLRPVWNALPG